MKTMLRRFVFLMLCFVLVTSSLPVSAYAAETGKMVVSEVTEAPREPTQTASESAETSTEPSEELSESTEATTESSEELSESTEATTESSEEIPESTEASTESSEELSESTEVSTESSEDPSELTDAAAVPAEPEEIAVTGITLDQTALTVEVGALPVTLTATVAPENATDQTVTWTSSEPGVASVADGVLTFGYMGQAVITATAGEFSAACTVTVEEGEAVAYEGSDTDTTYVLAGSDFQARNGHDAGAEIVSGLLNQIKVDYPAMNGFLFAGDYDVNYNDSANGKAKLQETVQGVYGTGMDEIYIQGNHDGDSLVGATLTASGANDTDNYGVFVINEKDYMWYNNDETTIKNTAAKLDAYLDAKVTECYTKPIFVVSHLPLHYSMRTRKGGNDGMHANYIFDVLNEAGNAGLNIIFLFGHNHSHGWDDYLGGAAIFLTKGDKINIAQNSTTNFKEETLAFTYMNAGYVGYYGDSYTSTVDKTLTMTMTTFAITDENVTISRYDSDSTHDLKSAGVYNVEYPDSSYYSTNTATVGSPYTLALNQNLIKNQPVEMTDESTGITVSAPGITGVTVLVNDVEIPEGYSAYASYDITLEGYEQGDSATVTIPAPANFNADKSVVVLHDGSNVATTGIVDGKITFTTDHFSVYDIAQYDEDNRASESGTLVSSSVTKVTELESGNYYLIEAANDEANPKRTITGTANGDGLLLIGAATADNTNLWYLTYVDNAGGNYGDWYFQFGGPNGRYLTIGDGSAGFTNDATRINMFDNGDTFAFRQRYTDNYMNQNGGRGVNNNTAQGWNNKNGGATDGGSQWNFYKVVQGSGAAVTLTVAPKSLTLMPGTTKPLASAVLVDGTEATSSTITWTSSDTSVATVDGNGNVTGIKDGTVDITATLTSANGQSVDGTVSVNIPVTVQNKNITSITADPMTGSVQRGAAGAAKTGSKLTVTFEDGTNETVDVTVSMLSGSDLNVKKNGTYTGLTITYAGKTVGGYTLNVVNKTGNNYPEYPNEGAVKVSKTGTGIDFQSSGIAQVEVSASGVPVKKGADVIVMLDLSSSMDTTVSGATQSRLAVLKDSMEELLTQLKANGPDGQPMDIRIAVADFHGYYTNTNSPYYIDPDDTVAGGEIRDSNEGPNQVYTGSGALNAGAFVDVHTLNNNAFDNLGTYSGTNYDYAFDAVYQLGEAITTQNATDGKDRDLYVIFMSDGAPFQYNYFSSQSEGTGAAEWNNWLTGTLDTNDIDAGANASYYNEDGKHWMAEAIKGDPADTYHVIRKNNAADTDNDNWVDVNGLGATMYSIGFCLQVDKEITVNTMDTVIRNIASEEKYYYRADNADALSNAFTAIGNDIAYAANNARFVDQMGDDYNLQMAVSNYNVVDGATTTAKTITPKIEILSYDIYTKAEAEAGTIPTGKNIGDRKGTSTVIETVTFNAEGTEAYSTLNSTGPNGETVTAGSNILIDGVIYANTFWYNTKVTDVTITGVNIPTGINSDGTTTGSSNVLPSETFYWKLGTVQTSELAMRYYVYLDGSMEGTREGGSYPTNEYATLYYDNYLENPCYKDTVSPVMAWKEANVSYAFYLVDENGNIIVNQTTGQTGSFANKIAVTNPVVYETVLLNSDEEVSSIDIASLGVLPEGYTLYDYDGTNGATYTVTINSNTTGNWTITTTKDVHTTYVTQYDPNDASAYSNDLNNSAVGDDYTHTIVWFAVVWKVQALPDTVVIDYGLPVDISVLTNDMFGENGKLAGVGAYSDDLNLNSHDTTLASGFKNTYTGTYGVATANADTGKVRYTLNTSNGMQMQTYEKFAYAVNYTGTTNPGYYYDTVTVIPATTIYYEDSFLTLAGTGTDWKDEGTAVAGATQAEDRPGAYSLTDANNIYGYDSVNNGMSTYSLGTAKKVHVGPLTDGSASSATASFTFYGTGFDIIGMTSNTTGVLAVKVEAAENIVVGGETKYTSGATVKNTVVDTYYGYNYGLYNVTYTYDADTTSWISAIGAEVTTDGAVEVKNTAPENPADGATYTNQEYLWVVQPDVNKAMYQVPVLQTNDLPYGKYKVTLIATYMEVMDDTTADGYDLYLDAIRIYDPANDGAADGTTDTTIEDAYKADGEGWPSYIELRNNLIDADTLGNATTDTKITGLVFIDGDEEVGDAQITDYVSYGPNNEVYLAPGQSVAFMLNTPGNIDNVHIGIKSADGQTGTYTISNIAKASNAEAGVEAGKYYGEKTYTVNTTTDMYYDLTGWKGDIIVISNTGDKYDTAGVISLTNIKSTYISDPNAVAPLSEEDYGVAPASEENVTEGTETSVYMTASAATLTLRSLNSAAAEIPEEIVPDESEPETSEPETSVPEETEPDVTEPEEEVPEVESVVKEIINKVKNTLKNLFSGWFR